MISNTSQTIIPGIDQPLPAGEQLLWRGKPSVMLQLRHSLALRVVGLWLVVAALMPLIQAPGAVEGPYLAHLAWVGVTGIIAFGIAWGFSWLVWRTTTYAITDQRVILAHGIALPSVLNIPLERLEGARCRVHKDGSGDISLPLESGQRLGYALLWPHARPWKIGRPEPSLRWVEGVEEASDILTQAAMEAGEFEARTSEASSAPSRRQSEGSSGLTEQIA